VRAACKCRISERPLRKHWCIPGRDQEHVAFAQGDVEALGQSKNHVARRHRTSGFDKAQVARRDPGIAGKVELAHAPAPSPFAQMVADQSGGISHGMRITQSERQVPLPAGSWNAGPDRCGAVIGRYIRRRVTIFGL
jgi:hypothetical protein